MFWNPGWIQDLDKWEITWNHGAHYLYMIFFAANVSIRNCSSCVVLNYSTALVSTALASNQCSFANIHNSDWQWQSCVFIVLSAVGQVLGFVQSYCRLTIQGRCEVSYLLAVIQWNASSDRWVTCFAILLYYGHIHGTWSFAELATFKRLIGQGKWCSQPYVAHVSSITYQVFHKGLYLLYRNNSCICQLVVKGLGLLLGGKTAWLWGLILKFNWH